MAKKFECGLYVSSNWSCNRLQHNCFPNVTLGHERLWIIFFCSCCLSVMVTRSVSSVSEKSTRRNCTCPFNWGDARFQVRHVKRSIGPTTKMGTTINKTKATPRARPTTEPRQNDRRHGSRSTTTQTRWFGQRQLKVRRNARSDQLNSTRRRLARVQGDDV